MRSFISRKFVRSSRIAVAALGVMAFAQIASAAPILPGGVQSPAIPEPDPVNATLLATTGPVAFNTPTFSGSLVSSVFVNDASSPFGPTGLTFTYQLVNNPNSSDSIGRLTVSKFDGFLTDASFNPNQPVGGTPPTLITRSANGQVMGFDFVPGLAPNTGGATLVVQTNSTQFNPTLASVIDGSNASVASFAPQAIPEPASIGALALGTLMLVRRRQS